MPAFLISLLTTFASSFLARLLLGAGLMVVTYAFTDNLVAKAQAEMGGLFYSLPADVLGLVSILKIPQGLSIIVSALGIAAFIKSSKVMISKASG